MKQEKPKKLTPDQQKVMDNFLPMGKYMAKEAAKISTDPSWMTRISEQFQNFVKAGLFLQPHQLKFCIYASECDGFTDNAPTAIMCGGGRGSAKTHGILAQIFADDCQRFPNLKVLLIRKIGKANQEQVNDYRTKLLANIPHEYKQQAAEIHFPNGSKVILGNYKDERDLDRYMGLEFDVIFCMETNQLTFAKKKFILTCLRTSKQGWKPRLYEDTNPGGIGMAENKQMYVVPWRQGREKETGTRYIHSTVYDNAFINKEYVKQLETLTGWQRKAWLEGDWDFAAGAFFTNFIPEHHVHPNPKSRFNDKAIKRVWLSYDYGFAHNAAAILHARDCNGVYCALDEFCESEQVIAEQAEEIKAMLRRHHYTVQDMDFIVAGKDCFSRNEEGKTIAQAFDEQGISMTPADVDRQNGWKLMHALFGDISKGIPTEGYVHQRCTNLIEQIQMAQHSMKRPGDIEKFNADQEGRHGDDALDACARINTMVLTSIGEIPIQNIRVGMLVWTREGLKPVVSCGKTGDRQTITVKFSNGQELTATPEHRILTRLGWKRLDSLGFGDRILSCKSSQSLNSSNLTESSFVAIPTQSNFLIGDTTRQPQTIGAKESEHCTKKSGNPSTAQFLSDFTYTTKTGTLSTITLKTLKQFRLGNIFQTMVKAVPSKFCGRKWLMLKNSQLQPTKHQSFGHGLKSILKTLCGNVLLLKKKSVKNAERNTSPQHLETQVNFAPVYAGHKTVKKVELTLKKENASSVAANLNQENTTEPSIVDTSVTEILAGSPCEPVYNLEVADCPEYFANGILVHNCRFGISSDPSHAITFAKALPVSRYQMIGC